MEQLTAVRLHLCPFPRGAAETRVAPCYVVVCVIVLAVWHAGRRGLIRSPRPVVAYVWERMELWNALGTYATTYALALYIAVNTGFLHYSRRSSRSTMGQNGCSEVAQSADVV
jgi:hypothetical protein